MNKKVYLPIIAILLLSFLASINFAYANPLSTVGTTNLNYGTLICGQVKSFYAVGKYWVAWHNGAASDNIVYATSTDGATWSGSTILNTTDNTRGDLFSWFYNGSQVSFVFVGSGATKPLYYRVGTPVSDGTISWISGWSIIKQGGASDYYYRPVIVQDANGYDWVGVTWYDAAFNGRPMVVKNAVNDGSWVGTLGFPYQLDTMVNSGVKVIPDPLPNGDTFVSFQGDNFGDLKVYGKYFNETSDTWGSKEQATVNNIDTQWDSIATSDCVTIAYKRSTDSKIVVSERKAGVWVSEFAATTSTDSIISISKTLGDSVFVFMADVGSDTVHYVKKYLGSWTSDTVWYTDVQNIYNDGLTSWYYDYNSDGVLGIVYNTGTASPYNVRFEMFTGYSTPTQPLTTASFLCAMNTIFITDTTKPYGQLLFDSSPEENFGYIYPQESPLTSVTKVIGMIGYGLQFDGVNGYIRLRNDMLRNVNQFTIEGWIKRLADSGSTEFIFAKQYLEIFISSSDKLTMNIAVGDSWSTIATNASIDINTGYFFSFVFNTTCIIPYLNAQKDGTPVNVYGNTIDTAQICYFGRNANGTLYNYNGIIDEFRVFSYSINDIAILLDRSSGISDFPSYQFIQNYESDTNTWYEGTNSTYADYTSNDVALPWAYATASVTTVINEYLSYAPCLNSYYQKAVIDDTRTFNLDLETGAFYWNFTLFKDGLVQVVFTATIRYQQKNASATKIKVTFGEILNGVETTYSTYSFNYTNSESSSFKFSMDAYASDKFHYTIKLTPLNITVNGQLSYAQTFYFTDKDNVARIISWFDGYILVRQSVTAYRNTGYVKITSHEIAPLIILAVLILVVAVSAVWMSVYQENKPAIQESVGKAGETVSNLVGYVYQTSNSTWNQIWAVENSTFNIVGALFNGFNALQESLKSGFSSLSTALSPITSALTYIGTPIVTALMSFASAISQAFIAAIDGVLFAISGGSITNGFSNFVAYLGTLWSAFISDLSYIVTSVSYGTTVISSFFTQLGTWFTTIWGTITFTITNNPISNFVASLLSAFGQMWAWLNGTTYTDMWGNIHDYTSMYGISIFGIHGGLGVIVIIIGAFILLVFPLDAIQLIRGGKVEDMTTVRVPTMFWNFVKAIWLHILHPIFSSIIRVAQFLRSLVGL